MKHSLVLALILGATSGCSPSRSNSASGSNTMAPVFAPTNNGKQSSGFEADLGREGGGGDTCEARIGNIRTDLKNWIDAGGHKGLELPSDMTADTYSSSMKSQLLVATVQCVSEGYDGYPVTVQDPESGRGVAKICRFDKFNSGGHITCDRRAFLEMSSDSDQYILIHHEFAGLAGIERPQGATSHYEISDQLAAYLTTEVVTKLAVRSDIGHCTTTFGADNICSALIQISLDESLSRLEKVNTNMVNYAESRPSPMWGWKFVSIQREGAATALVKISSGAISDAFFSPDFKSANLDSYTDRLRPLFRDELVLRFVANGPNTLVLLQKESIAGGSGAWANLAACQMFKQSSENCAKFSFDLPEEGLSFSLNLKSLSSAYLEDNGTDSEFTFRSSGQSWSQKNRYSNGDDLGDDDIIESTFDINSGTHFYFKARSGPRS